MSMIGNNPLDINVADFGLNPDTCLSPVYQGSEHDLEELVKQKNKEQFNSAVDNLQERFQEQIDTIQKAGESIAADLNKVEIMPIGCYALVEPFGVNPFQKTSTTPSGLIVGGVIPEYQSMENGQPVEGTQYVRVGTVMEVGADCKFLKQGDIVFYNKPSEVQVPFFNFGFVIVAEQRVLAVVNEGLTARRDELLGESKDES